jgi:hypothetical protein
MIEEESPFSWGFTAQYSSMYEFRGADFGDDLLDFDLSGTYAFNDKFSLTAGAWYASLFSTDYTELDLYAGVEYALGPVTLGAGYTWYHFPQGGNDINEPYATVAYDLFGIGFTLFGAYDDQVEGYYLELSGAYSYPINEKMSLEFEAGGSFGWDYYFEGNKFNHAFASVGLAYAINENATLTPWMKGTKGEGSTGLGDQFLGGVSLAFAF